MVQPVETMESAPSDLALRLRQLWMLEEELRLLQERSASAVSGRIAEELARRINELKKIAASSR